MVTGFFLIPCKLALDHQPIEWDLETYSSGVKRPEREVDRATASSSEVNNVWNYTSIQLCVLWHSTELWAGKLYILRVTSVGHS